MAKRRKRGSGSVRLRKDGRWEGRAVTGYDDKGLQKRKMSWQRQNPNVFKS